MILRNHPILISFLMAIPLAAIIILLLPPLLQEYEANLLEHQVNTKPNAHVHYFDINNDGVIERISEFDADLTGHAALYIDRESSLIDQFNFSGVFPNRNNYSIEFGDYDSNDIYELYFITRRADSAYLNIFSLNQNDQIILKKKIALDKLSKTKRGIYDFIGIISHFKDLNQDGYKEIFIRLQGYYSKFPRKVFIYDHKNDHLKKSGNFAGKTAIIDIYNIDNQPRILLSSTSSANIPDTTKAIGSDFKEQLFLLDTALKVIKGPENFGEYHSSKGIYTFNEPGYKIKTYCIKDEKINDTLYADMREYDKHLSLLEKNNVPLPFNYNDIKNIRWINNQPILFTNKGVYKIFPDKNLINEKHVFETSINFINSLNIDEQHEDEILLASQNNNVIILGNDLKITTSFNCPIVNNEDAMITKIPGAKHQNSFMVQNKKESFTYSYNKNDYYFLQYPSYIGIYLLIVGFLHIITRYTRNTLEKKYEVEHEMRRLQILSTKNQTSPHFTYNLLNSLSIAILNQDRKKAQKIISKMAMLMRSALDDSESIERTLEEELEFVKNYLSLEKERIEGKMDFSISIDSAVNRYLPVPKMLLQIFAENAVKHGIRDKTENALIAISASQDENKLVITITDNGIGREEAKQKSENTTGQGFKILDKIIDHYKALNHQTISYRLLDLHNDRNQPAGTRVIIKIE